MKVFIFLAAFAAIACAINDVTFKSKEDVDEYLKEHLGKGNDEVLDQCKIMNEECLNAAWLPHQTALCFLEFGLCVGARVFTCAKSCIPDLIACKIQAIGSWSELFKCTMKFIDCAKGGCPNGTLSSKTDVEVTFSSQTDVEEYMKAHLGKGNDEVLDQCKIMNEECLKAAWLPHQTAMCFIQFGICVGTRVFRCAQSCIPDLIQCKIHAIGSWSELFKCTMSFIECAKAGCPHELSIASSYTDMVEYGRLDQCMDDVHSCLHTAGRNLGEVIKCYAGFGVCIGQCAFKCVGPMVVCKLLSLGDLPRIAVCCAKFLVCAKDACAEGSGEMAMIGSNDDVAYDMAVAAIADVNENGVLDKCKQPYVQCIANAGKHFGSKMKCFVGFTMCIGKTFGACSASCVPSLIRCAGVSSGDWTKMLTCATDFLVCANKSCTTTDSPQEEMTMVDNDIDDYIAYDMAIAVYTGGKENDFLDKCRESHDKCVNTSGKHLTGKIMCFIKFGTCIGKTVKQCSVSCVPWFLFCSALAGRNYSAIFECGIKFLDCADKTCQHTGLAVLPANTAVVEYGKLDQCIEDEHQCTADAGRDLKEMLKCYIQLGLCMGGCSAKCVPSWVLCRILACGDQEKIVGCCDTFLTCSKSACHVDPLQLTMNVYKDVYTPYQMVVKEYDVLDKCTVSHNKCVAAAGKELSPKFECFITFGYCISKQL